MGIQKMLLPKWFHLKLKKEGGTSQKGHHRVHTQSQNLKVHQRLSKLLPLLLMYVSLVTKYSFYGVYFQLPAHENIEEKMLGSRKFKWLRDRLGATSSTPYSSLMQQIKQFVLSGSDVGSMEMTLNRQVTRAELRFTGICSLIELLNCQPMLPSVKYSALCGWMSLLRPTRYTLPYRAQSNGLSFAII